MRDGKQNVIQGMLGGKGIRLSLDSNILLRANDFFPSNRTLRTLDASDLLAHFSIAPAENGYSPHTLDKIFSMGRMALYRAKKGYVQRMFVSEGVEQPLWELEINQEFSRFDYFLHVDTIKKNGAVDPWRLATAPFLLQHSIMNHCGLVIHAAGGSVQGKGMVFSAPSGTGKSTLSRLLLADSHNRLFSEERLIIRSVDKSWYIWGTPWHGESDLARNESVVLSTLVFLRQSQKTKLIELSPETGLRRLLQTVSIPWYSEEWANKGLALCELLLRKIPVFELAFRPDQSAAQAVEQLARSLA